LAGTASAALALGISELAAGIFSALPSLVEAIANWVIDSVPGPIKDWAIQTFGTADKTVLIVGICLVSLGIGALVGLFARRLTWLPIVAFIGFGAFGAYAATRDPNVSWGLAVIPAGLAAITGLAALQWLMGMSAEKPGAAGLEASGSRRQFIVGLGAVLGVAVLAGGAGRYLIERAKQVVAGREEVILPAAAEAVPPFPSAAELAIDGLSPVVTPVADFYRIDTAISPPRVDLTQWSLSFSGMVERPYTIDYSDLLDMRMVERYVTLSCVSNQVGGGLVGNALWLGVPLSELLDRAGLAAGAEQIVGRSVDGFTVGFPTEVAYDGRDAMLAVGMNGEPLPFEHGFPARLVVAGLYGYVSATKWISEIEMTGWDTFDAYWIPRGWSKEAPVKTQSRIDTLPDGASIEAAPRRVAGVAWAPNRGISMVEVQLGEDAEWVEAELSEPLSDNSWRQWVVDWDPSPGRYQVRVRATDGEGDTQTEEITAPAPNGATGWHTVSVEVA
jgi:DMSO/TMAO reductase YedYZ molybdopterin-dependent catalytic subunit